MINQRTLTLRGSAIKHMYKLITVNYLAMIKLVMCLYITVGLTSKSEGVVFDRCILSIHTSSI